MAEKPGERFKKLKGTLMRQGGVTDPAALAAAIGRKVHAAKKFPALATKSK